MNKPVQTLVISAILATFAQAGLAADVGQHPAIFVPRALPAIDANTFIPGHPAGGRAGHAPRANFDHPAVVMHRAGQVAHIDPNTFIVQPPATTVWLAPEVTVASVRPTSL
jgi:hypothetical protein